MRLRSKSENDFFEEKSNLDILHNNLKDIDKFNKRKKHKESSMKITNTSNLKSNSSYNLKKESSNNQYKLNEDTNNDVQNTIKETKEGKKVVIKVLKDIHNKELQPKTDNISTNYFGERGNYINENTTETGFKEYLKLILSYKHDLDYLFFQIKVCLEKEFINNIVDIIISKLIDLKSDLIKLDIKTDDICIKSPNNVSLSNCSSLSREDQCLYLEELLENLILLIITLRKLKAKELYRESKVAIFKMYSNIIHEIKSEFNKMIEIYADTKEAVEINKLYRQFRSYTQMIIFIFSDITIRIDYYHLSLNTLMSHLNNFFANFIKNSKNQFVKSLKFLENYITLKGNYMQIFQSSINKDLECNDDIFLCKFLSFGRFFFNNMYELIETKYKANIEQLKLINTTEKNIYSLFKKKIKQFNNALIWRSIINITSYKANIFNNFIGKQKNKAKITIPFSTSGQNSTGIEKSNNKNDKYYDFLNRVGIKNDINSNFKTYFNSKLAQWKSVIIDSEKKQLCKICEESFNLNVFVMHIAFCAEHRNNIRTLELININLNKLILTLTDFINLHDNKNTKNSLLSPRSEFRSSFKLRMIEKKTQSSKSKVNEDPSLIDYLVMILEKEKIKDIKHYESSPDRLDDLNKLILTTLKFYLVNKKVFNDGSEKIFANLFSLLMKKQILLEKILTYYETMGFLSNKTNYSLLNVIPSSKSNSNYNTPKDNNISKIDFSGTTNFNYKHSLFLKKKLDIYNQIYQNPNFKDMKSKKCITEGYKLVVNIDSNTSVNNDNKELKTSPHIHSKKLSLFNLKDNDIFDKVRKVSNMLKGSENIIIEENNENECMADMILNKHPELMTNQSTVSFKKSIDKDEILNINRIIETPNSIGSKYNSKKNNNSLSLYGFSITTEDKEDKKYSLLTSIIDNHQGLNEEEFHDDDKFDYDEIFNLLMEIKDGMSTDEENQNNIENISPANKYKHGNLIVQISDFTMIKKLNNGGYGTVGLYRKNSTKDFYAIKKVNISNMKTRKSYDMLKTEMKILNEVCNDYVVKIFFLLRDSFHYYFVMEYIPGGDLLEFTNKYILTTDLIRHIICEIILGLEYLHGVGIIHRDIKPENVVLSIKGHVKLTDFGISMFTNDDYTERNKLNESIIEENVSGTSSEAEINLHKEESKTNNLLDIKNDTKKRSNVSSEGYKIVGTDNYIAPEVLNGFKVTKAVDFWALGVVIFEMVTGKLPFSGENSKATYENIRNMKIDWIFLENSILTRDGQQLDVTVIDLIKNLIVLEPEKRLGYEDIQDLKSHPFLKEWNWTNPSANEEAFLANYVKDRINKTNKELSKIKNIDLEQIKENLKENFNSDKYTFVCKSRNDNLGQANREMINKSLTTIKPNIDVLQDQIDY